METDSEKDRSIKSLIELGARGHFPLFEKDWPKQLRDSEKQLTVSEKSQAKELLKRLHKHRGLERKRSVLFAMSEEEREIVVRTFLSMVEKKIRVENPDIH